MKISHIYQETAYLECIYSVKQTVLLLVKIIMRQHSIKTDVFKPASKN